MKKHFQFLLLLNFSIIWIGESHGQSSSPIPLNQHYFEIDPEDSINHFYTKLISYSEDSTMLERIFTLDQKVHRVVMTKPTIGEYQEQVTDQYKDYLQLDWRKTENLLNSKFLTVYYYDNEVVGQVLSDSHELFYVARNGESEPIQQTFNDFEPQISGPKEDWYEFAFNNFRLSSKLYPRGTELYWIAVLVNEHGMVGKIEWANPLDGNPKIAAQYIRVLELWGNNFSPALDPFGNPVEKWLLIPFKITGGRKQPLNIIKIDSF